jgi:tetratricopeptide (TPR) repeat protein
VGRGEEIQEIIKKLSPNKPTLLLNGIGGVGKTELCRKFYHDNIDRYDYVGWIDYRGNLKDSFTTQFDFLEVQEANINADEYYKQIIHTLSSLPKNTLLIVDDITNEKDDGIIILRSLPFNVICTSRLRIEIFEIVTTDFLSEDKCKELFKEYYKGKDEEAELGEIIMLAGRHTLTVELLAKTAANAHIKLEELLTLLKEKGFNLSEAIKEKVGIQWHNEVDENLLFEHLQKVFNISGISKEEENILINLSILPSAFIEIDRIKKWLKLETYNYINSLVKKGWLIEYENKIYCHQTIRDVVYNKFLPKTNNINTLIDSLADELYCEPHENPLSRKGIVDYAKSACSYIKEEIKIVATLYNNLSMRYKALGKPEEALKYQLKAVEIREKVLDKDHPDLATSYNNLSLIYKDLGKYEEALKHQFKAVEIREKVLDKDHPSLATSYNNLSLIYKALGKPEEALKYQLKDVEISEKVLDKDHPDLATSYNNLSLIYQDLGKLEEALKCQFQAVEIREKILDKDHPNLGVSYWNFAVVYYDLKDKKNAKKFIEKCLEIFNKSLPPDHPYIKRALNWRETINKM